MANHHDIGDVVVLWVVYRNEAGVQTAPTDVSLLVTDPHYVTTEVDTSEAEAGDEARAEAATGQTLSGVTGVYRAEVEATLGGRWRYRWFGTGAIAEEEEGSFPVRRRLVGTVES